MFLCCLGIVDWHWLHQVCVAFGEFTKFSAKIKQDASVLWNIWMYEMNKIYLQLSNVVYGRVILMFAICCGYSNSMLLVELLLWLRKREREREHYKRTISTFLFGGGSLFCNCIVLLDQPCCQFMRLTDLLTQHLPSILSQNVLHLKPCI